MIKCFQLTHADGKVCGVKATGADGSEISFTGKAVLLATGGLSFKAAAGRKLCKAAGNDIFHRNKRVRPAAGVQKISVDKRLLPWYKHINLID